MHDCVCINASLVAAHMAIPVGASCIIIISQQNIMKKVDPLLTHTLLVAINGRQV